MTPDQLITFSVVAELLNISQAARQLHLSQPAVSGQLQALQQSFGEPLYHRHGRGIQLTPAGRELLEIALRVRQAMLEARELKRVSQALEHGLLRLGASTTPASYLLPGLVAGFRRTFPGVSVQMFTGNSQQVLERIGDLDLVFVEGELDEQTLAEHRIRDWRQDEVVAIVRRDHPLCTSPATTLRRLASEFLVMREQGSGVRRMILDCFASHDLPLPEYLELAGVEGVKEGVRAGLGVGFVSNLSLSHEDGSLAGIRIGKGLNRTIRIVEPGGRTLARTAAMFLERLETPETDSTLNPEQRGETRSADVSPAD
ncbi:LysR family transcriptional regulator [Orrella marina]|uniref:LysR family transcriptional regulator n=1 Tax=Orrella marina TaxID=2163011 RepID=A0A2R4XJ89_9BURK|nr:LysR family transcriptional regulator [Orrella marina]AWB33851.1 LysR family transcriptional regulator [Orrella marina]